VYEGALGEGGHGSRPTPPRVASTSPHSRLFSSAIEARVGQGGLGGLLSLFVLFVGMVIGDVTRVTSNSQQRRSRKKGKKKITFIICKVAPDENTNLQ
jgi:hypothetical protein